MTPAEQIRARITALFVEGYALPADERDEILAALDALESEHATDNAQWAERLRVADIERRNHESRVGQLLARNHLLETEHADRVWLTRDEAREIQEILKHRGHALYAALLDERIGDK